MTSRPVFRSVAVGAMVAAVAAVVVRRVGRADPRARAFRRRLHGALARARYAARGGHPDPDVAPLVLADRIRSELGPLVARLDVPHPHVMVEGRVVLLHGEVATEADAQAIEDAVSRMPGVEAVESYLAVGLLPSDTRPSDGRRAHMPSAAMRRLLAAARRAGVPFVQSRLAVAAVIEAVASRIPAGEREHLLLHLPHDVRALHAGLSPSRIDTEAELVDAVGKGAGLDPIVARAAVESVLGALRDLVPEETADVAAVLPADLREAWLLSVAR